MLLFCVIFFNLFFGISRNAVKTMNRTNREKLICNLITIHNVMIAKLTLNVLRLHIACDRDLFYFYATEKTTTIFTHQGNMSVQCIPP